MLTQTFVLAGKAIFTVTNPNGVRYTFKIVHKAAQGRFGETWFVNYLTGPNNTSDYTYIGMVDTDGNVRLTKASSLVDDSQPVRVIRWCLDIVWGRKQLPDGYSLQHAGRCGKCGRILTVPDSIESGIGPECMKQMNMV